MRDLEGTEEQKKWASKLRETRFEELTRLTVAPRNVKLVSKFRALREVLETKVDAKWWIETKHIGTYHMLGDMLEGREYLKPDPKQGQGKEGGEDGLVY